MPILIGALIGGAVLGVLTGAIWGPIQALADAMALIADHVVEVLPAAGDMHLHAPEGLIMGYTVLDTFLPLHEALALVATFAAVHLAGVAFHVALVVYHLIPKPGMGT